MKRLVVMLALAGALAGCKSKPKAKDDGKAAGTAAAEPMSALERKRAEDACGAYVAQACRCAEGKPDEDPLARKCRDAQVKRETLDSLLAVDSDPGSSEDSRLRVQIESRKVMAKCVMEHASLPSLGCR